MVSLARLAPFQDQAIVGFIPPTLVDLDREQRIARSGFLQTEPEAPRPQHYTGGLAPWQIKRVRAYIDDHLAERMPLKIVAAQVRLSTSYFSRSFSKSLGLPFQRFVAHRRIEHAQQLMVAMDQRLSDIALTCGFADQSHFSRTFSRLVGETPARWRRRTVGPPKRLTVQDEDRFRGVAPAP